MDGLTSVITAALSFAITALLVSCFILRSAFKIFMDSNVELMDGVKDTSVYQKIFDAIGQVEGIKNPHRVRSRQIGNLYRLKFNFLDEICRQYYSYGLTAAKQRNILKAVEGSISELSGDRDFGALEAIVNTFKNDVMRKLRDEFPQFKEEEFRLMCYWYAGFSSSAMSLLLKEEDVNAVYKKRSRLKGKIEKSGSPLKEFFIKELSK